MCCVVLYCIAIYLIVFDLIWFVWTESMFCIVSSCIAVPCIALYVCRIYRRLFQKSFNRDRTGQDWTGQGHRHFFLTFFLYTHRVISYACVFWCIISSHTILCRSCADKRGIEKGKARRGIFRYHRSTR